MGASKKLIPNLFVILTKISVHPLSQKIIQLTHRSVFIQILAEMERYIAEYLMDELSHRHSPENVTFLIKTSILERFNASLCIAVLDEEMIEMGDVLKTA